MSFTIGTTANIDHQDRGGRQFHWLTIFNGKRWQRFRSFRDDCTACQENARKGAKTQRFTKAVVFFLCALAPLRDNDFPPPNKQAAATRPPLKKWQSGEYAQSARAHDALCALDLNAKA